MQNIQPYRNNCDLDCSLITVQVPQRTSSLAENITINVAVEGNEMPAQELRVKSKLFAKKPSQPAITKTTITLHDKLALAGLELLQQCKNEKKTFTLNVYAQKNSSGYETFRYCNCHLGCIGDTRCDILFFGDRPIISSVPVLPAYCE